MLPSRPSLLIIFCFSFLLCLHGADTTTAKMNEETDKITHSDAGYRLAGMEEASARAAGRILHRLDGRNNLRVIALNKKIELIVKDINSMKALLADPSKIFTAESSGITYTQGDQKVLESFLTKNERLEDDLFNEEKKAEARRVKSEGDLGRILLDFADDETKEGQRKHELKIAMEQAKIEATESTKASIERLKILLSPRNIALLGGATGLLIILYFLAKHSIPMLLKKTPSYMRTSIQTKWQRLFKTIPREPSRIEELQFSNAQSAVIEGIFDDYTRCINSGIELTNMLFYGAPGTGKTMTARALALELGADYIIVNSPELSQLPDEEAIQALKYTVELARSWPRPVFVFFDEADAIFMHRGSAPVKERKMTNELLSLIPDAYEKGVAFIFATNLPDALDPAFKRRIGRKICFDLPDLGARITLFTQYLTSFAKSCGLHITSEVHDNVESLADSLEGFSGSDIAELAHEIRLATLKESMDQITVALCQEIIQRKITENELEASATYQTPTAPLSDNQGTLDEQTA